MNPSTQQRRLRPGPARTIRALIPILVVVGCGGILLAQYGGGAPAAEGPFGFDEYPSLEGVIAAHESGKTDGEIIAWLRDNGAYIPLSLDEALQLKARGVSPELCAAMSQLPPAKVKSVLREFADVYIARAEPRRGLSRRQILKMLDAGASDEEVAAAVAEQGSRADLSLEEAIELQEKGLSGATLCAVARGAPAPAPSATQARAQDQAGPPSLDDIFAETAGEDEEEEVPLLDDLLDDSYEDEEEEPAEPRTAAAPAAENPSEIVVLSDAPDAKAFVAPGSARVVDLLRSADSIGRTPARSRLDPGPYYVLVEKRLDPFDHAIIPAFRTVHDGSGRTRTLIESGQIYYDTDECCLPRSLEGEFSITRISENQQGVILGDAFDGLPPYVWDGNRFLVLTVEGARVTRIMKVYEIRKAAGERQTVVATFTPSHRDPLLAKPAPAEADGKDEPLVTFAPDPAELTGVAEILGVAAQDMPRIHAKLRESGAAVYRQEDTEGRIRMIAFNVDGYGRLGVRQSWLEKSGPFGMYATSAPPAPSPAPKADSAALPAPERTADPNVNLPFLSVTNSGGTPALLMMGNGTAIYLGPGQTRQTTVAPGATTLEALFADRKGAPRKGRVTFSYYFRYTLIL